MSWDSYITDLIRNDEIEDVAIWGKDCGQEAQWAASDGLKNITVDEIKKLTDGRADLRAQSPCIGGKKCMLLRDNRNVDNQFNLDLKTLKDESGKTHSVYVGVTVHALIIAKGKAGANAGTIADLVYRHVKYLRDSHL